MKHKMKRKRRSVGNVKRSETLKSFKKNLEERLKAVLKSLI